MLVLIGGVTVGLLLNRTASVSNELLDHIAPARVEAYRLQTALLDQETGLRGYVATGDRTFLTPFTEGTRSEPQAAHAIRTLVRGRTQQAADVDAIEEAADHWRRTYARPAIDRVTEGAPRSGDLEDVKRGKEDFDQLRTLFAAQNQHLTDIRNHGRAEIDRVRALRNIILSSMLAVFLLTCLLLAVLLRRLVTGPLQTLRSAARRVAAGDFGHHISASGPADVQALAKDVEAMRGKVVAALATAEARGDALARQAAELDVQTRELRRSNSELEQFAYVASHDLQEPLRKVASFCQMLERRYADKLDDRGRQYIDFAVDGAKRMQILINDLLTFSRVGRMGDARVLHRLDSVLDKALTNLASTLEETQARIHRPEQLPEIVGDPTLLTMLWQNLLGNSVKFREAGRAPDIRITCEPQPGEDAGTWLLSVTDNGIGIPEEFTEKVFVIFQRLHGRDSYTGTGIGLALCKKIVEFHGGKIWIDAAHTDGTRLCFTLPTTPPQTTGTPAAALQGAPA
ncbi:CHASE3 domain-containing protein [Streptomyces sp. NPDC053429]|uniref:sensor histidine kinase n=1 Tax=Streptomyces sp. NPDC053429 TaxID=3365702 RepID=UPI0037D5983B